MFSKSDRNQTLNEGDSLQITQSHWFAFSPNILLHDRSEHIIIISVASMRAAIERLLGEQLEALCDCFFGYSSVRIPDFLLFSL